MKSRPSINTYSELYHLPGFLENNTITPENFHSVVDEYDIRDVELNCCLEDENGRCGQGHFHGYVIELKDGSKSIMGKDCAQRKFGAEGAISTAIKIFKNTKNLKSKLGDTLEYAENFDYYRDEVFALEEKIRNIKEFYRELSCNLSRMLLDVLNFRYKAQRSKIEVKCFKYNRENELIYQATNTIGYIPSLNLFNNKDLNDFDKQLKLIKDALRDSRKLYTQIKNNERVSDNELDKRTKKILSELKNFENFKTEIKEVNRLIIEFYSTDLSPLCFISTDTYYQEEMALYVMKRKDIQNKEPYHFIRQLEIYYSTKLKCHQIEAV